MGLERGSGVLADFDPESCFETPNSLRFTSQGSALFNLGNLLVQRAIGNSNGVHLLEDEIAQALNFIGVTPEQGKSLVKKLFDYLPSRTGWWKKPDIEI